MADLIHEMPDGRKVEFCRRGADCALYYRRLLNDGNPVGTGEWKPSVIWFCLKCGRKWLWENEPCPHCGFGPRDMADFVIPPGKTHDEP